MQHAETSGSTRNFSHTHLQTDANLPRNQLSRIESPNQVTQRPTLAPYGMLFGQEKEVKQREAAQYREDLNYLCNLRNKYGNLSPKEWEEYNRKLNYMNDRYVYGEMDKKNFLRGMNRGYEDEMRYKKEQDRLKKQQEAVNDRKKFQGYENIDTIEREHKQKLKQEIYNDQLQDLENFHRRKEMEYKKKRDDDLARLKFQDENDKGAEDNIHKFTDKINDLNKKVYDKVYHFNKYMNEPINSEAFNAKNDLEFNKLISEQKGREKKAQKKYQDNLDLQNLNDNPHLLMPAYFYPNRPIPLHKKAKDSLFFSKEPDKIFNKDMNKFFHWDAQYNTMMDYDSKGKYLGDSVLRHNPITCPVNDYNYNRYVNRMKQNFELPPQQETSGNVLLTSGERIMK